MLNVQSINCEVSMRRCSYPLFFRLILIILSTSLFMSCGSGEFGSFSADDDSTNSSVSDSEYLQNETPENISNKTVLYGVEGVELGSDCLITGSILSGADVSLGSDCQVSGDIIAKGNLTLASNVKINGSVYLGGALSALSDSEITGVVEENVGNIPEIEFPEHVASSGEDSIIVKQNQFEYLDEGSFNQIRVYKKGKLYFNGGDYFAYRIGASSDALIVFLESTTIILDHGFFFGKNTNLLPRFDTIKTEEIKIASLYTGTHSIGSSSSLEGLFYVPNGPVDIGSDYKHTGRLWAKNIVAGSDMKIEMQVCVPELEICGDNIDQDCDGVDLSCDLADQDGDGFTPGDGDCNDSNASINPDATEVCDNVDNNCNGDVDEAGATGEVVWYIDNDNDSFGTNSVTKTACNKPSGYASNDQDCDDGNANINPNIIDACDGLDNNCNGEADEGLLDCENGVPIPLPVSPDSVATEIDMTVATDIRSSTSFLYSGDNPIQAGVAEGTIEEKRVAVIRGYVSTRSGQSLPAVTITIQDHTEFGSTMTRSDGMFDIAVNGGTNLIVNYKRDGYLPVSRRVEVPQRDFVRVKDVVMIEPDPVVTTINLSSTETIQIAEGSPVTDSDGVRQGRLMFSNDTSATLKMQDGTEQPIENLNVRVTEYTVGSNGLEAMPGELPATSAYTYAAELSVDEAIAVDASSVNFSKPVIFYLENFLGFPVGEKVPLGYFDREKAAWVPSDNGLIVKVLSIESEKAVLALAPENNPATSEELGNLGVTDAELEKLALLYTAGETLWRMPIPHFSGWDANWGFGPPEDAVAANQSEPVLGGNPLEDCCVQTGSIIECENQVLGENIDLAGSEFDMNYRSSRVDGRKASNTIFIPLSGEEIPTSLKTINLEVMVAGQKHTETVSATPNQNYTFIWDGKDAYGRELQGSHPITVKIGYVYDGVYESVEKFGYNGNGTITGSQTREEVILWQEWKGSIGSWDLKASGFGGWSLSQHHAYDPYGKVLYLGDGTERKSKKLNNIIDTVAGNGVSGYSGDGGEAVDAQISYPKAVVVDAEGNLFIADGNHMIRKVDPDGMITKYAGDPNKFLGNYQGGSSGDGGPALLAKFNTPEGLAIDSEGNLLVADTANGRIRKINQGGIVTTIAGIYPQTGVFSGDGGPATEASLLFPRDVAVDEQGNIYIADQGNKRIRKINTDGIITTIAGNGTNNYGYDGVYKATEVGLCQPEGIDVDAYGNVYVAERTCNRVRKISINGKISVVAGGGLSVEDGVPALEAELFYPIDVVVGEDSSLYISENNGYKIRKVLSNGKIVTVAGDGGSGFSGDGGPAIEAMIGASHKITKDSDGSLYITGNHRVRKISSPFPGISGEEIVVASEDGSEIYHFDSEGRHLETKNSLTGTTIYTFSYDEDGFLTAIEDRFGNITIIDRSTQGKVSLITPYSQTSEFTINDDGYVASIKNPNNESVQFEYLENGLMTMMTDSKGQQTLFDYDDQGRLIKDQDPVGGFISLGREELSETDYKVTSTTALGRTKEYEVKRNDDESSQRKYKNTSGLISTTDISKGGDRVINYSDGSSVSIDIGPDPRFGMIAPILVSEHVNMPSGLTSSTAHTKSVTLLDDDDLLSVETMTDTVNINGVEFESVFDAATKTITMTTPESRESVQTIDENDNITKHEVSGVTPVDFSYDDKGRLVSASQGSHGYTVAYDTVGNIANLTDAMDRVVSFAYDPVGRPTSQTLPDGRVISYSYDANGNITSITPPSKPAHLFEYDARDELAIYLPPLMSYDDSSTKYEYNLDKDLAKITRPDDKVVDISYDEGGRTSAIATASNTTTFAYNPTTGNLQSLTESNGNALNFTYDGSLPLVATWSGEVSGSVGRAYDNNFRVASLSVNGSGVSFSYDNDGLLVSAGDLSITRNAGNGFVEGTSLGSVLTNNTYNEYGELSSFSVEKSGADFFGVSNTRDALGRITTKTEVVDGVSKDYSYEYDLAGRLVIVSVDGIQTAQYGYDDNGNRISATIIPSPLMGEGQGEGEITATYDDQDRLTQYGNTTYTYTTNGELKTKTDSSGTTNYTYDEFGNLVQVQIPSTLMGEGLGGGDTAQIDYIIDSANRRVGKKINNVLVSAYLYEDQLRLIAELNPDGSLKSRFIYGTRVNVPEYMVKGGVQYRLITDHLGSVRFVVNADSGDIAQQINYDEFGVILSDTTPGFQPFGFAGGLYDTDTKLTRFGARDYDAMSGRWTSKDPIGFNGGDTNLYGYVWNDGINLIDPNGEVAVIPIILGAIGAYIYMALDTPSVANAPANGEGAITGPSIWDEGASAVFGAMAGVGISSGCQGIYQVYKRGKEYNIGKNVRVAPLGNRTGHRTGRWPHYHRRGYSNGVIREGQGLRRHRPWEVKSNDTKFIDRF